MHEQQVLLGGLVIVIVTECIVHRFAALNLVADLAIIVVTDSKVQHLSAGSHVLRDDVPRKEQSTQGAHTAQRHIELPIGKHAATEVKREFVEGQALALVDSDGPCELERELGEGAGNLFLHLSLITVVLITDRIPAAAGHSICLTVLQRDADFVFGQLRHSTQRAVRPTLLRVITREHHLSADPELKHHIDREATFVKLAIDSTLVGELCGINVSQALLVDGISSLVD